MKTPAYLFGPFVGELSWEFYRFAPYAIHKKKEKPEITLIVFTRQTSFDLYGRYADVLIPLRIPNDLNLKKNRFKIESIMTKDYNLIANRFKHKYRKRFDIVEHCYPDIANWRYKIKWQFPRRLMDYDFKPREKNKKIARTLVNQNHILLDDESIDIKRIESVLRIKNLVSKIIDEVDEYNTTLLGTLIECIKRCKMVVGKLDCNIPHLALLLKKPVVCINNKMSLDSISLLNPFNTPIIYTDNIEGGIEEYDTVI